MKPFETTGLWFLPEDESKQIPGKFEFTDEGRLRLDLSGSFQRTWNLDAATYPIICGSVSDSPYGKFLTLFQCFATSLRFGMPGAGVERISANYGFAGSGFVESKEMLFDRAAMYFSTLGGWLSFTGLKQVFDENRMGFSWSQPEPIGCSVADAFVHTGFDFNTKGAPLGGAVTLEEMPALVVDSFGTATADDIHSKYFAPLNYLMAFASDGRSQVDRYTLFKTTAGKLGSEHFDRIYSPAVKYEQLKHYARKVDLLFSLDDVKDRLESFMQRWFSFVETHPNFCTIFFSYGYERHGFVDTRFVFLMQSLECLAREANPDDPTLKSFEALRAMFLEAKLLTTEPYGTVAFPTAEQMATPTLVGKMLNRNWALISELVGTSESRFMEVLYATLERTNSRTKDNSKVVSGSSFYWLLGRLLAVVKVCVLKEVGFSDDEVNKIVRRNPDMTFIKKRKGPWESEADGD